MRDRDVFLLEKGIITCYHVGGELCWEREFEPS